MDLLEALLVLLVLQGLEQVEVLEVLVLHIRILLVQKDLVDQEEQTYMHMVQVIH
jgi:hypothetical protein